MLSLSSMVSGDGFWIVVIMALFGRFFVVNPVFGLLRGVPRAGVHYPVPE
jgi:hypothetical protein